MRRPFSWLLALGCVGLLLVGCGGGGARDIEKLLADLMGSSARARSRAERVLAEHGRSVVKPLSSIVTLKDIEKTVNDYGLRKDPKELRIPAARALGVIAAKASLARSEAETASAPLLEVLKGKDRALRVEAARALGFFTQLSAPANDLILTFREDDAELVAAATEALARNALRSVYFLAPPQEPPVAAAEKDWTRLLERILSTDDDIRLDTVRELAALTDPEAPSFNPAAAPLLLERVAQDKSRDVRYTALCYCLQALQRGKPEGFAEKLHAQLPASFAKDDDSRVAFLAARSTPEPKPERVGTFLARIEAATRKAEERLFADAKNTSADAGSRSDAIDALVLLPGTHRDEELARLLDPAVSGARIRRSAASVLATSESEAAVKALTLAMGDGDSVVKLVAAQALGRKGDLDAVRYLVDLLGDDEASIRADAAGGIGILGANAVPALVKHLRDSLGRLERKEPRHNEKHTAWGIVTGLGRIAEQIGAQAAPALTVLLEAAECHDEDVRRVAAIALGYFPGEASIAALARRLKDPDESVQWYALVALERHGTAAVPALLGALGDEATSALVAGALGRVGDAECLKPLLDRLSAATEAAKAEIVWSIGELLLRFPASPHEAAARGALEAASRLADGASEVARAARHALAKVRPKPE
ncbi:MAG TPA: HEAT repeat domain-containing protein [Planctomycetota bacterium]|nr:HEAT repeat domain-containing protein [Planctomycetota bacterium]